MLKWQIESLKKLQIPTVVATTSNSQDDAIEELALSLGLLCVRGPEQNVYERFKLVTRLFPAKNHIRVTGDCPLISPKVTEEVIELHTKSGADYSSNFLIRSFPDGLDVEVFSQQAFNKLEGMTLTEYQKEHVTPAFYQNPETFNIINLLEERNLGDWRWTIDFESDFAWLEGMLKAMKAIEAPEYEEIKNFVNDNPSFLRTQKDAKLFD
jgi:spore coat polysaccharide biosynthesis protein SpsF